MPADSATGRAPGLCITQGAAGCPTLSCGASSTPRDLSNRRGCAPGAPVMRIGVPKEIKNNEYRVGMVPAGVRELTSAGHEVIVETGAGNGIGVDDAQYKAVGASIAAPAAEVFQKGELIVKVKDPQPNECEMLRAGQVLFT